MLGNATTTMYWSSETISIANDSSASVAPLRSRASGTPCGSGRPAAAPVSAADPGTESLPPARIPRHPVEVFPGLLVRGPARARHLGHNELPGQQPPQAGRRRGGLAPATWARYGSHSATGAGSSSTTL